MRPNRSRLPAPSRWWIARQETTRSNGPSGSGSSSRATRRSASGRVAPRRASRRSRRSRRAARPDAPRAHAATSRRSRHRARGSTSTPLPAVAPRRLRLELVVARHVLVHQLEVALGREMELAHGADHTHGYSRPVTQLASVYPLVTARAVAQAYTYEVPDGTEKGAVVEVRFGNARRRGVVTEVGVQPPPGVKTAPVVRVAETLPPALVDLALWMADYYGSTPARALALVAPHNAKRRGERSEPAAGGAMTAEAAPAQLSEPQERVLARIDELLDGGGGNLLLARRDGKREDRGLHPRLRGCARAWSRRDRARAGDRAHTADARTLSRALRRSRRRPALGADAMPSGGTSASGSHRARRRSSSVRARRCSRPCRRSGSSASTRSTTRPTSRSRIRGTTRARSLRSARRSRTPSRSSALRHHVRSRGSGSSGCSSAVASRPRCRPCASSTSAVKPAIRCRRRCSPSWAGSRSAAGRRSSCSTGVASRPRCTAAPAASRAVAAIAMSR